VYDLLRMEKTIRYSPFILIFYASFLVWLSLSSASVYPQLAGRIPYIDKIVHFCLYLVLALLIQLTFYTRIENYHHQIILTFLISFAFGLLMEILQSAIPALQRTFEWGDVVFNIVGSVAGILFASFFITNTSESNEK
jgi:VanZ family protein